MAVLAVGIRYREAGRFGNPRTRPASIAENETSRLRTPGTAPAARFSEMDSCQRVNVHRGGGLMRLTFMRCPAEQPQLLLLFVFGGFALILNLRWQKVPDWKPEIAEEQNAPKWTEKAVSSGLWFRDKCRRIKNLTAGTLDADAHPRSPSRCTETRSSHRCWATGAGKNDALGVGCLQA